MQSERKYKIYHNFIAFYEKILSCKRKKSFIINFVLLKYNWITLKITYEKIALYWQIIIGMILGVLLALLMLQFSWGKDWVLDYIKPFGVMFLNALKLIAVPLILASLIKGISDFEGHC
ncbi:hypothetical protein CCAN11_2360040 [Capnocytophaga canimorsus]|uniref:Uncharacterized protein n=1 Tax=Capnocytophaga canimorsus TaxID=28188 RepID=A0A0B7IPA1_9FLAO|nr:hypothetical protein CCAN11_2360040 [Capnocytophaga canimorsus]